MRRLIWLAVLALVGCDSTPTPSDSFKFTFNPPDDVSFTVELNKVRTVKLPSEEAVDSTWTLTRHRQLAVDTAFELTGITDTVAIFHNGEPVTDPVVQLFAAAPITYVIDRSGTALEVKGYDTIFAQLDAQVGPEVAAQVRQMVNPASLADQEISTWNAKFNDFAGREMKLGEPQIDTTFPNMPIEGQMPNYRITELVDTVRIDSKLCGRVKVVASTNPTRLAELSERSAADVVKLFALDEQAVARATLRQAGSAARSEWLLEFETMLTHEESSRQELFYQQATGSGFPARHELFETQTKQFTYSTDTDEN